MEADAALRAQYPEMARWRFRTQHAAVLSVLRAGEGCARPQEIITIPVIVHVVHQRAAGRFQYKHQPGQVQSQIDVLNEDYRRTGSGFNNHPAGADVEIQFALAVVDPFRATHCPNSGIDRINGGSTPGTIPQ